jgi:hypothetical protein
MLKGKYVLLSLAAALVCWQAAGLDTANSGIVDPCKSTVAAAAGVVLVCPLGDGDLLSATASGTNSTITLTVRDNTNTGIEGIPTTDMWLVGCADGLLLCGGSQGSNADVATGPTGVTTFTQEPTAGGCDTGLYAVVQGVVIQQAGACQPLCLPIAARSPDYKSTAGCPGDNACPDSRVSQADFSWFTTHYTVNIALPKPYHVCADYAKDGNGVFGTNTLSDFTKFTVHFAGAGHKCPI